MQSIYFVLLWVFIFPVSLQGIVLQEEVWRDLELVSIYLPPTKPTPDELLDVAIIGGGQSGLALTLALYKQGIYKVLIFDQSLEGDEGPWCSTARMNTLRTEKEIQGPALDIPHLTFRAWYEAQNENWEDLGKIPTIQWGRYLQWYRQVLELPVKNEWALLSIEPEGTLLKLTFNEDRIVYAKKVVLATGLRGFGGFQIPGWVNTLPNEMWSHTGECIDLSFLAGKRLCIIGSGASAFDIAGVALEAGAQSVDMVMRKETIPQFTPFTDFSYWPAFFSLPDLSKAALFHLGLSIGIPPPLESVHRAEKWPQFHLNPKTTITSASYDGTLHLFTADREIEADYLVLATGYAVNLSAVAELSLISQDIKLWGDAWPSLSKELAAFPYLGSHFEFQEKSPQTAPFLKQIHCFNQGALLSHGFLTVDIDSLPAGTARLAEGIASDLFLTSYFSHQEDMGLGGEVEEENNRRSQ